MIENTKTDYVSGGSVRVDRLTKERLTTLAIEDDRTLGKVVARLVAEEIERRSQPADDERVANEVLGKRGAIDDA